MSKSHSDELLTPKQVAAEWSVTTRTIQRYITAGTLPATRLPSGRLRIRRSDADAALTVSISPAS